jgi:DnaK suppressor protein
MVRLYPVSVLRTGAVTAMLTGAGGRGARVDEARARALLDEERRRLDRLGRAVSRDHDNAVGVSSPEDPVESADRRLTEETSEALGERLRDRWGALERAEARLAAGTYGASVLSGRPIPDERLEAFPLAELTVDEATVRDRDLGGRREPESRIGPSRDPFRVFEDPAAQDDGLVEDDEGSDDEPGPEANIGIRTTPEA